MESLNITHIPTITLEKDMIDEEDIINWLHEQLLVDEDEKESPIVTETFTDSSESEDDIVENDEEVILPSLFQPPYNLPRMEYYVKYTHYRSIFENEYNNTRWSRTLNNHINERLYDLACSCDENECIYCESEEAMKIHRKNLHILFRTVEKSSSKKKMQIMIFIWNYIMENGIVRVVNPQYMRMLNDFLMMLKFVFPLIQDTHLIQFIHQLDIDTDNCYFH
jgi:hypothetical protein